MNDGTRTDLRFIRDERADGSARAVMVRAAQMREYLLSRDEGYVEATLHLAWAYGQLGRYEEADALFETMIDRYPDTTPHHHAMALCDYALLLHKRGLTEEANRHVRRTLDLAASTANSQVRTIAASAAAEIAAGPAAN